MWPVPVKSKLVLVFVKGPKIASFTHSCSSEIPSLSSSRSTISQIPSPSVSKVSVTFIITSSVTVTGLISQLVHVYWAVYVSVSEGQIFVGLLLLIKLFPESYQPLKTILASVGFWGKNCQTSLSAVQGESLVCLPGTE